MTVPWWSRPGLEARDGRLFVAGRDAESVARERGTPLFAYDLVRIEEQARSLVDAFERIGAPFRLRYALKAQREPEVLAFVRSLGFVGLDVCSPREIEHGLANGWAPEEISFTGTNLSERDLDTIVPSGVHVNLDLLSQLDRFGRRAPGSSVGIRVNPRTGAASWPGVADLYTGGHRPSKFGILEEQLDDALEIARRYALTLDTVHFHVGRTVLTDALTGFEVAVERASSMARRIADAGHTLVEVNAGGGWGVPQAADHDPLDVRALAEILTKHLGDLDVRIALEPGDYLTKQMGVLLAEVITVDDRDGHRIVGLDAGFNVAPGHFIYDDPVPIVVSHTADAPPDRAVTVAGNINEGDDLWGEYVPLPAIREGDVLGLLLMGSYGRAMHMDHCLRPPAGTAAFADRV